MIGAQVFVPVQRSLARPNSVLQCAVFVRAQLVSAAGRDARNAFQCIHLAFAFPNDVFAVFAGHAGCARGAFICILICVLTTRAGQRFAVYCASNEPTDFGATLLRFVTFAVLRPDHCGRLQLLPARVGIDTGVGGAALCNDRFGG